MLVCLLSKNNYVWLDICFIDLQIAKYIQLCNGINGNNGSFIHGIQVYQHEKQYIILRSNMIYYRQT